MRHQKAEGRKLVSILLVLFLCFATCICCSMGIALAAYSPTVIEQVEQQAPWDEDRSSSGGIATHGGMSPAQSENHLQEGMFVQLLPAQVLRLPNLCTTACHALCAMIFLRPLSELASRTGGHAPP